MNANIARTKPLSLDRIGLIVVTLVGMAMCAQGVGKVAISGQWLSFQGIFGTVVGILILSIVAVRLSNRSLPMIATDRAAIAAVLGLAAIKLLITALFPVSV